MNTRQKQLVILLILTILALIPSYLARYSEVSYRFLFNMFTTYPGDLWNFYENYLVAQNAIFPPEYPAGLRFFYEAMQFYKYHDYTTFFNINFIIILFFALASTFLLFKIIDEDQKLRKSTNIIWFFIFAPSFVVYSTLNYDLPVVFLIIFSYYLFSKNKYAESIISLGLGTALKVFPVFLLPIFILKAPKEKRLPLFLLFCFVIFITNIFYFLADYKAWIFPYTWQIGENLSKTAESGTYWWIFYKYLGSYSGWVSLGIFGGLYYYFYQKIKNAPISNLLLMVVLLFLFTDRIYSPQYNLYLLPFLVLVLYPVNKKAFYLFEIPNIIHIIFLFWLKEHVFWLQILVFCKYAGIAWLFYDNYKYSIIKGKSNEN